MQFTCPKCRRVTNLPHPVHGDKRSITCGCGQVCEVPSLLRRLRADALVDYRAAQRAGVGGENGRAADL